MTSGVQGQNLVAQDVVARREVGDGQVPGEVVLDEVVGHPGAWVVTGFPGARLDLGPLQRGGVGGAEVAGYRRDVFLHGSDVGDGPGVLWFGWLVGIHERGREGKCERIQEKRLKVCVGVPI